MARAQIALNIGYWEDYAATSLVAAIAPPIMWAVTPSLSLEFYDVAVGTALKHSVACLPVGAGIKFLFDIGSYFCNKKHCNSSNNNPALHPR